MLVALFAEDIDLLAKYFVTELLDECTTPADTYDLIGGLFEAMNTHGAAGGGRYKGVRYFNGGLFAQPARMELGKAQNWCYSARPQNLIGRKFSPKSSARLFQQTHMDDRSAAPSAQHFTSPFDIMKIVRPTIVEPWREQIEGAKTLKRLGELRDRLHHFRVLDPACGSGNFLYIAYRELKRLEARIFRAHGGISEPRRTRPDAPSFLSAQNFYGLDIQPFAVEIAKVTMMIARKLAIDELHITEPDLPLDNLDKNFIAADACSTPEVCPRNGRKADVIIGNPPFLGAKLLKPERGPDYVNKLRRAYAEMPGMADYCVYWFRKAARPSAALHRRRSRGWTRRTCRHAKYPQQPISRGRTRLRREDRHDCGGRGKSAVVGRSQRPRLHRQLGENAGRRAAAQDSQALVQSRAVCRCKKTPQARQRPG